MDPQDAKIEFVFEDPRHTYDSEQPIIGTVNIKANKAIAAYMVTLKLELKYFSKYVTTSTDEDGKTTTTEYTKKDKLFEKSHILVKF